MIELVNIKKFIVLPIIYTYDICIYIILKANSIFFLNTDL